MRRRPRRGATPRTGGRSGWGWHWPTAHPRRPSRAVGAPFFFDRRPPPPACGASASRAVPPPSTPFSTRKARPVDWEGLVLATAVAATPLAAVRCKDAAALVTAAPRQRPAWPPAGRLRRGGATAVAGAAATGRCPVAALVGAPDAAGAHVGAAGRVSTRTAGRALPHGARRHAAGSGGTARPGGWERAAPPCARGLGGPPQSG